MSKWCMNYESDELEDIELIVFKYREENGIEKKGIKE